MDNSEVRLIKRIFDRVNSELKDCNQWVDRGYESLEPGKLVPAIHHWVDKYFRDMQYRIKDLEKDFLSKFQRQSKSEDNKWTKRWREIIEEQAEDTSQSKGEEDENKETNKI